MPIMLDMTALSEGGTTRVLSGKQRGLKAREDLHLEALDQAADQVDVVLADDVDAITPSFVLGMFGASVRRCGSVDSFFDKYHFRVRAHLIAQVRRGAEYSLLRGSPLPL